MPARVFLKGGGELLVGQNPDRVRDLIGRELRDGDDDRWIRLRTNDLSPLTLWVKADAILAIAEVSA